MKFGAQGKFLSQWTVFISEFSSPFCSSSSCLTSIPPTEHTHTHYLALSLSSFSCHFPEKISKELPPILRRRTTYLKTWFTFGLSLLIVLYLPNRL